ncbi:ABC transporter permease [Microvirga terrae]|uniref:ABC transporter permease n=1 Tax=Microvirga terrae TaxID=2740529 RepID=A0ABY5RRT7_9HYPH|nr:MULTISPECIES: ABC transporter permease [Microvirga]MBQ0823630.1 ABC transporter permease [Microvirga sp. HBU67558]UVF19753.1 ABC transporter permease [Microvirga terrae]
MRLILELALTHIAGRGRQTIVAILGVALGVGFSIAMAALMQGTEKDFVAQLVDTMPHVQITDEHRSPRRQPAEDLFAAAQFEGLRPKEDRRGILNPAAATASLRAWVPGRMAQALRTQGVVRYAGRDVGVTVIGIEPEGEAEVSSVAGDFLSGSFDTLRSGGNNIVVGDRLAQRLGASTGTTIQVVAPTGQSRGFRIVGQFHTGTNARDEGEAYVLLKNAQILSERPNAINDIRLRLDDPAAAPRVARQAEAELGYKAVPWQEANESLLEALVVRNVVMYTVVGAILLVAGFGIFNIISTITHEKARDIAILKSLGFTQANMRRLFLIEGLALGLAGSVVGWAIGLLLCLALSQVEFKLSGAGVGREMTRLPLFWSVWHYAIASAFALVSAGVAGYLPARQAARLNPVDIIRGAT